MRIFPRVLWALAVVVLSASAGHAAKCALPEGAEELKRETTVLVNRQRVARGLNAVAENPNLGKAAQRHACDMAVKGYFSHTGKNRSNAKTRIMATGYSGCLYAENIARGQTDSRSVMDGWMESSGHKKNILLRQVNEIGMGVAVQDGRLVWVQVLACRR